mmetsp:Transcript_30772/g.56002  ORF Transcript_30772/g.56002 Transcript_30772/m.56002 type:complete len:461 (-) Transcript_30772:236-1618(-)|eukprot:CAMPEP_0175051664 /NCGR_PEP_ID=MMETSP0052_2-20121109/7934_1 /TAXON_ID=51329 ORGANISM="Polytomella parva, Strain SAG 63-3" /NCGR_SAMPLE_ID=MMETSP0052_2 /ASSEMBLY_ACC=CAM_ASM_000194 /LENGTH=460 /DNA_ID=CAMNT_0016315991 /DNA_START=73 /DNA_END=1455 /DNA_ORIENTATION=-
MENVSTAIIDYGTRSIRAGLAHDSPLFNDEPRILRPSAVISRNATNGQDQVHFPIKDGQISDLDMFEALIHSILYDSLGWQYGVEGQVMLSEPLLTNRVTREMVTQLLFEIFNVQGLFIQDQATLSLFAVGKASGLVVDLGESKTDIACVIEGQTVSSTTRRLPVGGAALSRVLRAALGTRGIRIQTRKEVDAVKEAFCRCFEAETGEHIPYPYPFALASEGAAGGRGEGEGGGISSQGGHGSCGSSISNTNNNSSNSSSTAGKVKPTSFTLPDGQVIVLTTEGFELAEMLFNPSLIHSLIGGGSGGTGGLKGWGSSAPSNPSHQHHHHHQQQQSFSSSSCTSGPAPQPSLVETALDSVMSLGDLSYKRLALEGVFACGGGAQVPGLSARLVREIRAGVPPTMTVSLSAVPEYLPVNAVVPYASWVGAAVLARVLPGVGQYITKGEYDEYGPSLVHRRCT